MVYVSTLEDASPKIPIAVETISEEKTVLIKWNIELNKNNFFAYHLERSASSTGPFTRLNTEPLLFLKNHQLPEGGGNVQIYTDSIGVNYQAFYYRLIGINHFAEESQPSDVVKGMGVDKTPPFAPRILKHEDMEGNKAFIQWEKPVIEPDLKGFIVGRSNHPSGIFTPLHQSVLPVSDTEFIDTTPNPEAENYYEVAAVDTAGNITRSLSAYVLFPDLTPPVAPIDLVGSIDTNGLVTLNWTPNMEEDLLGYRVYWANAADHKFIMVSSDMITEPTYQYQVSLKTLTEQVYFRISAVDKGYGHSEFSPILKLKRPDIMPPSPGAFSSYKMTNQGIELNWNISSSSDLASQELLRRPSDGNWCLIQQFDKTVNQFIDQTPDEPGDYEYVLRTIDDDGLKSAYSTPIGLSLTLIKELSTVENLKVTYLKDKNTLQLNWTYANPNHRFVIYRSINGEGLRSYKSVSGAMEFSDVYLPEKGIYRYAIRVLDDAKGIESALAESNVITVAE